MTKLEAITTVQQAAEAAMQAAVDYLCSATKPTSEEVHAIIDTVLREHDCESPEGHIVASGLDSAEPHEQGSGLLAENQPIIIDIYPRSKTTGYWADMTRTVCLGTPSEKLQHMFNTVLKAQTLAFSLIKPGLSCATLHSAVADYFAEHGYTTHGTGTDFRYAEGFVHSLGHGVGKAIHEIPFISPQSDNLLMEGDIIAIEPGLYYKNIGGVRLEDLVVVTSNGHKNLTRYPKRLRL